MEGASEGPQRRVSDIPVLNDAQVSALHTEPDHGIQPVTGIFRFKDLDEWMQAGGTRGGVGNFSQYFTEDPFQFGRRERECFQRFEILYPGLKTKLFQVTADREKEGDVLNWRPYTAEEEEMFFDAYHKMADLVDVGDTLLNASTPDLDVDPALLMK